MISAVRFGPAKPPRVKPREWRLANNEKGAFFQRGPLTSADLGMSAEEMTRRMDSLAEDNQFD